MKTTQMSEPLSRLRTLVEQNRRRWRAVILLEALGWAVALPLAYLWLMFVLDAWLHLPFIGRFLASLGALVGALWAARHLWLRWRELHLTEDEVALAIERRTPGQVENRLINAIQLARAGPTDQRPLSDAVVEENVQRLQQVHLQQAAHLRPALIRCGFALAMIVGGGLFWLAAPTQFGDAAVRILLPLTQRTRLVVEPGDTEAVGELPIRVTIEGERPETLTLLTRARGKLTSETIPAAPDGPVSFTLREIQHDFVYAVRGGDFTSPFYQVTVPLKASLARMKVSYQYPPYTNLAEKTETNTTGELEAVQGTRATVHFQLDQPADAVTLTSDRLEGLAREDARTFHGTILFERASSYRLEVKPGKGPPTKLGPFPIRVLKDQEPKLELTGLQRRAEVSVDAELPLEIKALDDFGLEQVGLFFRRLQPSASDKEDVWQAIATWTTKKQTSFRASHALSAASLQLAEGDKLEVALRAVDTDPVRAGTWTTGALYELTVGGDGALLQHQYEQILQSERDLKALAQTEQAVLAKGLDWLKKLDGSGELRWDDPKNMDALHRAVKELGSEQASLRKRAGEAARSLPAASGNVRIAVGLLADSEMVRVERILDSVPGREQPHAKRAALADARLTLERVLRSLQDLQEQYALFRSDWELGNMIPFTKMLAERQVKLRDQSAQPVYRLALARRQAKLLDLCHLIHPAFISLSDRLKEQEPILSNAFGSGALILTGDALSQAMRQAITAANADNWADVARHQSSAAEALTALHALLRQAQQEAVKNALAALKEKAKSDLEAQKELDKLKPGSTENYVKDYPDDFKIEDLVRVWEVAGKKRSTSDKQEEPDFKNAKLLDVDPKSIELDKDSGVRQDPYSLKLGTQAEKTPLMHMYKGKDKNKVKPFIQEEFDDLVGKLLDEADELHKDYQTINLSTNQNNNDPGEIGKLGGALNSTGAVAATGNKKPPTTESGGVSRTGRQGARAYGMVADQDTFNRKGRDQALEGQEQIADQAGRNKMKDTDENQKDSSTGVGGKKIDSTDSHFSVHDAAKWKDDYAKRMEKPQAKNYLVERQGDKLDPKVAAQLRDLTSKQEQVIERLKSIKKELKNLYLPTDHLEDLAAALQSNLESLKDRPDAELFRLQVQALDRLRGALRVFQSTNAGFQPSLPRERAVRGRVLDEPNRPALPGYEEAVRQYYLKLATD